MSEKKKHIATVGAFGVVSGKRVGTEYLYTNEEVSKAWGRPGLRFRNEICKANYELYMENDRKSNE